VAEGICQFCHAPLSDHSPAELASCDLDLGRRDVRRWGEPAPTVHDESLPIVHELVRADLLSRLEFGVAKYGQPLRPRNSRNALKDAYEEALDLCCYLAQALWEQEHPADQVDR
jgi:hypothetical protein